MLKNHCFLAFIIVERSGKLSEIKFMTLPLVSSGNAGNLKLFRFQMHSEFQRKTKLFCMTIDCTNNSTSKVGTFKFTQDSKLKRE